MLVILHDAIVKVKGYEIGQVCSWQWLKQVGINAENVLPIVEEVKQKVFDEEDITIQPADYEKYLGKTDRNENVDSFIIKMISLFEHCYEQWQKS